MNYSPYKVLSGSEVHTVYRNPNRQKITIRTISKGKAMCRSGAIGMINTKAIWLKAMSRHNFEKKKQTFYANNRPDRTNISYFIITKDKELVCLQEKNFEKNFIILEEEKVERI